MVHKEILKKNWLKICMAKTEGRENGNDYNVNLGNLFMNKIEKFKYLGSVVQEKGIHRECNIRSGWIKWWVAIAGSYSKKVPLKVKFYKKFVKPVIYKL